MTHPKSYPFKSLTLLMDRPGVGESGGKSNDVVIGRWTNPQLAGDDGHDGAREECDWTWGKNIGGIL